MNQQFLAKKNQLMYALAHFYLPALDKKSFSNYLKGNVVSFLTTNDEALLQGCGQVANFILTRAKMSFLPQSGELLECYNLLQYPSTMVKGSFRSEEIVINEKPLACVSCSDLDNLLKSSLPLTTPQAAMTLLLKLCGCYCFINFNVRTCFAFVNMCLLQNHLPLIMVKNPSKFLTIIDKYLSGHLSCESSVKKLTKMVNKYYKKHINETFN